MQEDRYLYRSLTYFTYSQISFEHEHVIPDLSPPWPGSRSRSRRSPFVAQSLLVYREQCDASSIVIIIICHRRTCKSTKLPKIRRYYFKRHRNRGDRKSRKIDENERKRLTANPKIMDQRLASKEDDYEQSSTSEYTVRLTCGRASGRSRSSSSSSNNNNINDEFNDEYAGYEIRIRQQNDK